MRNFAILAVSALALAACGSDPAPGPTEQIIVREPGEAAVAPAASEKLASSEMDSAAVLVADGKAAFAVCSACHVVEAGTASTSGPNLHGVAGRAAGTVEGFAYSEAMKSSGIRWSDAELDAYVQNPVAKLPGTTMVAGAIADPATRKAVIAYLKDISSN